MTIVASVQCLIDLPPSLTSPAPGRVHHRMDHWCPHSIAPATVVNDAVVNDLFADVCTALDDGPTSLSNSFEHRVDDCHLPQQASKWQKPVCPPGHAPQWTQAQANKPKVSKQAQGVLRCFHPMRTSHRRPRSTVPPLAPATRRRSTLRWNVFQWSRDQVYS